MIKNEFSYSFIGDVRKGRVNLGEEMPVAVYRLLEYTMKETLTERYGKKECVEIFRDVGSRAGVRFAENLLDLSQDMQGMIAQLQEQMKVLKIGVLRVEEISEDAHNIIISVSEDLDCSGLPVTGEAVCNYDEGFIAGILKAYTGEEYEVYETDCWAKGDRVCRFSAQMK